MTIELNVYTDTANPTERRIFEMLTENTGTHFLDSGGDSGRAWQRNQTLTATDFMERPKASFDVSEWGNEITLDLFHFLNDRLTLSPLAKALQTEWLEFVNADDERSFFACADMEEFIGMVTGSTEVNVANSYNWENYLSQTIQYIDFQLGDRAFTMLQIHGGADVRGGYTRPQVFETNGELWSYGMQNATIDCTGEGCECPEGADPCEWSISIYGCTDFIGRDGSAVMTSTEFYELKRCPECGGELQAYAPDPDSY
jgi:hypothetical protein